MNALRPECHQSPGANVGGSWTPTLMPHLEALAVRWCRCQSGAHNAELLLGTEWLKEKLSALDWEASEGGKDLIQPPNPTPPFTYNEIGSDAFVISEGGCSTPALAPWGSLLEDQFCSLGIRQGNCKDELFSKCLKTGALSGQKKLLNLDSSAKGVNYMYKRISPNTIVLLMWAGFVEAK